MERKILFIECVSNPYKSSDCQIVFFNGRYYSSGIRNDFSRLKHFSTIGIF